MQRLMLYIGEHQKKGEHWYDICLSSCLKKGKTRYGSCINNAKAMKNPPSQIELRIVPI